MSDSRNIRNQQLGQALLYVLVDGEMSPEVFRRHAQGLVAAGVDVLQFRDKGLGDRALIDRARLLRETISSYPTLCIVNDRPDIARLSGADGVHIGQEELSVQDVRRIVGPDLLIGVSTHSLRQARQAVADGADYIGCGPTFPSDTKQFDKFPGPEFLSAVAGEIQIPAFAIGGVSIENVGEVLQTGFRRIAVSGAVNGAAQPNRAVAALLDRLG